MSRQQRTLLALVFVVFAFFASLWGSGVIPAIIPQAVPTANKQGNSTKFQLAGTNSNTSGNLLCNDANGNATDSACGGAAASVPYSGITSGTNTVAAMVNGTGASTVSTGTGLLESNKIRNYTVSTLPAATAGMIAYVTDGASATDCTTGSGSTKVLCQADGSTWNAVGGSGTTPGFVLIEQHSANNTSPDLDFTSCITSTYDTYQLEFINLVPATAAATFWIRVSTDGGMTYDTGNNYGYAGFRAGAGAVSGVGAAGNPASKIDTGGGSSGVTNTAGAGGMGGTVKFFNPLGGAADTRFTWDATFDDGSNPIYTAGNGAYQTTTAVNAIRITTSTGNNITSGTVRCYGLAK